MINAVHSEATVNSKGREKKLHACSELDRDIVKKLCSFQDDKLYNIIIICMFIDCEFWCYGVGHVDY